MAAPNKQELVQVFSQYLFKILIVHFYVDKASGTTRMEEYVPTLDVRNEAGTINLFDYLENEN